MRVAIFNGPAQPVTIERVADPTPERDELVVKIGRCGICGSDLAMTSRSPFAYPAGMKLGHEYAGEVVAFGTEVTDVKAGDRVTCLPSIGCGKCDACLEGRFLMCASVKPVFGGFGDYVAVPRKNAVLLPQSLSLSDGALVEPLACGLHALRMAGMRAGERVMVLGGGSMAIAITYWARVLGASRIVVASRSAHRRDILLAMGADAVHNFDEDDPASLLSAFGVLPDIVAECVGKVGMLSKAVDQVRPGGTVLSMGMCMQNEPILPVVCAFKEVRMFFPVAYTFDEFVETVNVFEAGHVKPDLMVSDVIALEDFPATLELMRSGAKCLKVHVDPGQEAAHV